MPGLIATVHQALAALGPEEAASRPEPAVSIKQSVKPEYIVCLDDGKKLKMLKRHLKTAYNMTPAEYRERWGLPRDYPMVDPTRTCCIPTVHERVSKTQPPFEETTLTKK